MGHAYHAALDDIHFCGRCTKINDENGGNALAERAANSTKDLYFIKMRREARARSNNLVIAYGVVVNGNEKYLLPLALERTLPLDAIECFLRSFVGRNDKPIEHHFRNLHRNIFTRFDRNHLL